MDPAEGTPGIPPEEPPSLPPDEADEIIKAASPRRLAVKIAALLFAVVAGLGALQAIRLRARRVLAHNAPMASIPAGTLRRGVVSGGAPSDAAPAHSVTIAPFQIDVTEVTVAAYALCVSDGRCSPPSARAGCNRGRDDHDDHPINCVDWYQAKTFCEWARKRLPTEEEWEYAARGGDTRALPWGDAAPGPTRLNACDSECRRLALKTSGEDAPVMYDESDGWGGTAPVGSFPAGDSPFGVKDMAGNVAEWTASPYCRYGEEAGLACAGETRKVIRGGSFRSAARGEVESTTRAANAPSAWSEVIGLRCAR